MTDHASFPLFHDHHSHPLLYAALLQAVDLSDIVSLDEACERIGSAKIATDNAASFVVAYGWKDNFFQFPEERLSELPPVAIFNLSLHWLVTNPAGRDRLRLIHGPDVDRIGEHDWYETNFRTILNWFAVMGTSAESLVSFFDHLTALGIGSVEELLLVDEREVDWFVETELLSRTRLWADPKTYSGLPVAKKKLLAGTKLFLDGALGSRTAAISQPYLFGPRDAGEKTNVGMLMYSHAALERELNFCRELSPNIAIHAIGDRALEQLLDLLESLQPRLAFEQIRIEHAQLINLDQARRARRLGVVLSMQPNFNIDSLNYQDRLAAELCEANNPFRMLIDNIGFEPGTNLIFGSDGMPHGASVAMQQAVLQPPLESQRLRQEELVAGYTRSDN